MLYIEEKVRENFSRNKRKGLNDIEVCRNVSEKVAKVFTYKDLHFLDCLMSR